jgi:hypothetical protein
MTRIDRWRALTEVIAACVAQPGRTVIAMHRTTAGLRALRLEFVNLLAEHERAPDWAAHRSEVRMANGSVIRIVGTLPLAGPRVDEIVLIGCPDRLAVEGARRCGRLRVLT